MEQFYVSGMSCASCQARVEKAVSKVEGVSSCSVNLLTNLMNVEGTATSESIISAVENAGYKAELKINNSSNNKAKLNKDEYEDKETPKMLKRLIPSVIILLILMYFSMGVSMWNFKVPSFFNNNYLGLGLLQMLLAIIIMIINQKFFINGFKAIIHKSPNMDTLISLGSSISFIYSVYILFTLTGNNSMDHEMPHFYFETSAMILTLITIGKTLESYSKGKTTSALKGLIKLAPQEAVILENEKEKKIPIEQVKKGDIFIVKPGESIPVDGYIISGETSIDESALTGESIPVDKKENDIVSAATLNQFGYIKCMATRVGDETTLSQIIKMVSDASNSKAPIAKIADKVSGIFVPVILLIALIVFIIWMFVSNADIEKSLTHAIAVLVISCPCALGLATPVAIMVGNGKGARNGILFKTAESLELTGKTKIIALDKTGTITKGKPTITDIIPYNNLSENELLKYAYTLENKSEHPLAKAINQKAKERNISLFETTSFKTLLGNGVEAYLQNDKLSGGSYTYISKLINLDQSINKTIDELTSEGKTPLLFIKNDTLLGIIAVSDVIKEEAQEAIKELKELKYHVVMLTGDNEKSANAIGKTAGVNEVISGLLPNEKEEIIKKLKTKGKVIMVGDGINDAPSLTSADIGIAIGAGTDIAIDAADIVLMNSSLLDVPAAIRLSKYTLFDIYENLFWAFIYNIILIPIASGAFNFEMDPMYGALAMSLSSFFVVMNALRLNTKKIYKKEKKIVPNEIVQEIKESEENMKKTILIEEMMCSHCEAHIKEALLKIDGVKSVNASFKNKCAEVELTHEVDNAFFKKAVEDAGYKFIKVK